MLMLVIEPSDSRTSNSGKIRWSTDRGDYPKEVKKMPTTTSSTIPTNIEVYEHRAKKHRFNLCGNSSNFIIEGFCPHEQLSINDIGCNYGQLLKEIKRRGMETKLNYFGYDIDEVFLSLAKRTFPDNADKFTNLDIEKENPAATDVTVCSATFEHLDNPEECLKKCYVQPPRLFLRI